MKLIIIIFIFFSLNLCAQSEKYTSSDLGYYICLLISLILCLFAGICSGLTVGYLSIDKLSLELKKRTGTDSEKRAAQRILSFLSNKHSLMSTLLIANAISLETLPIFLEAAVPSYIAVIVSTIAVVIFSEILPQALCTGPRQLIIAEKMVPLITFLLLVFKCCSLPLGKWLDYLLGKDEENVKFNRHDLKSLVQMHEHSQSEKGFLKKEEAQLITSTIDLREKNTQSVMTPLKKTFYLNTTDILNDELLTKILLKNFSNIPIYDQKLKKIVGFVRTKSLINASFDKGEKQIIDVAVINHPIIVASDTSILELLMIFQRTKNTVAMVSKKKKKKNIDDILISRNDMIVEPNQSAKIIGLVSLNDIFSIILNADALDDDIHQSINKLHHLKKNKMINDMELQHLDFVEIQEAKELTEKQIILYLIGDKCLKFVKQMKLEQIKLIKLIQITLSN